LQRLRPVLENALRQLVALIAVKGAAGKETSGLQGLAARTQKDLRDWADTDARTRGKEGGNLERIQFLVFHPRLVVACLTAAVVDGAAAVAVGSVRQPSCCLRF
jgi:hypothetical protein